MVYYCHATTRRNVEMKAVWGETLRRACGFWEFDVTEVV